MDLDDLIVTWFCLIDDALRQILRGQRLRERGPAATLSDSEVLTMEVVGEYLGLEQDTAIFAYFRRHWPHFFPALLQVHRTTFVRQAANLHILKERLWHWVQDQTPHDPELAILDSLALPICQFTRAPRARLFQGEAAFGFDHLTHHSFYGFRLHARVCWPGVISQIELTPGNGQELEAAGDLTEGTRGLALGDRNFWSPRVRAELASKDMCLVAPYRWRSRDPWPQFSRDLSRWRYRIDTIFGQLVERTAVKRIWAHDRWHLTNRLLRKILMHTLAVFTNLTLGRPPLHLADLVA
jgi:DDE family transposase